MMGYAHPGSFIFAPIFSIIFILGVILFLVWAIHNLKKDELQKWAIGLLAVGILGMIASSLFIGKLDRGDAFGKYKTNLSQDKTEWRNHFCGEFEEEVK